MIKINYLYRVRNLTNKRVFYGIHSTGDISFANPPVRLSELSRGAPDRSADGLSVRYDTLPEFTNKFLASDLKQHGAHNFVIESVYASAVREDVQRMYKQYVTEDFLKHPLSYNGMKKPHRCTSQDNPMNDAAVRAKMSKILKSKVIVRGPGGRIQRIAARGECPACKLVNAHVIGCTNYASGLTLTQN